MRIVIAAPRKSGGAQLRCLLSMAYGLHAPASSPPPPGNHVEVTQWLTDLPENAVATCDLPRSLLLEAASGSDVRLLGIIRHPYDLLVSNFDVAQQRSARGREENEGPWSLLAGQELTSSAVHDYALADFANEIADMLDWERHGVSVRYETLVADPAAVMRELSATLSPLNDAQVGHAVRLCPAENIAASRPDRGRRMPALPPGGWRDRMPAPLHVLLNGRYASELAELGYNDA